MGVVHALDRRLGLHPLLETEVLRPDRGEHERHDRQPTQVIAFVAVIAPSRGPSKTPPRPARRPFLAVKRLAGDSLHRIAGTPPC